MATKRELGGCAFALRSDTGHFWACVLLGNRRYIVANLLNQLWNDEQGQDIAEYAVMLAVILVIVVGTVRLIGSNANTVFSQVGSAIQ
jgi:Flp pilus assembly pilin Flp